MANTISKETLDRMDREWQRDFEREKELLEKMTESERIGYLAAKATFNSPHP